MSTAKPASLPVTPPLTQLPAWAALQSAWRARGEAFDLRGAFDADPARFERFSLQAPHVFADLSKQWIDADIQALLLQLANERGLTAQRNALLGGAHVNASEDRAALHTLLRTPGDAKVSAHLQAPLAGVHATLNAMLTFAEQVRADDTITDIVNIGIGGSDLGPKMVVRALRPFTGRQRIHFVSNVDAHELDAVLAQCRPESTLFLVASKTFTTLETMANARTALAWFAQHGGTSVARHFVGLTTNLPAAAELGITTTFGFWDWVGGRYSLWSAIGLSIAMAIGANGFRELLAGAQEMDAHFAGAPLSQNLPVQMGLLDVWLRSVCGLSSRCVAPYHADLAHYVAHLQQLEMESNGKGVDGMGQPLTVMTSPTVWGEPGSNGQHAFFQMLHQGPEVIPVEFVLVKKAAHGWPGHQRLLLANALAQARALMLGRAESGHRHCPGNRPSTTLLLDALTPRSLGALITLHEHRVFVSGAIWGLNSFDQWGVELGKTLAQDLLPRWDGGDVGGLDASTAGLLSRLRD